MQIWGYSESRGEGDWETCGNLRCALPRFIQRLSGYRILALGNRVFLLFLALVEGRQPVLYFCSTVKPTPLILIKLSRVVFLADNTLGKIQRYVRGALQSGTHQPERRRVRHHVVGSCNTASRYRLSGDIMISWRLVRIRMNRISSPSFTSPLTSSSAL